MTLTAGLGDIADADGLPASGYTYQWISGGSDILGATGSSLTLGTSNYNGQKLRVRVSFTDVAGFTETRTSDETRPVAPDAAACPTDAATVWCATLTAGQTLEDALDETSVSQSGYEARSGRAVFGSLSGATFRHLGVDYTVTALLGGGTFDLYFATTPNLPADGAGLTVHVQTYGGELDEPLAEGVLQSGSQASWFFQGALNTSVGQGDTLSDLPLIYAPVGRDQVVPQTPDPGTRVRVRLSYFATGPATGKPKITGTAQVGQTLTAGTSGISDLDGNTKAENGDTGYAYSYQWYRVNAGAETQITGATGSTYTLVGADADKTFRVAVQLHRRRGQARGTAQEQRVSGGRGERRAAPGGRSDRSSRAAWRCSTKGSGARCVTTAWTTRTTSRRRSPAGSWATRTAG